MALSNFLSNGGTGKKWLKLEIRPESEYVFLRGSEQETGDFKLRGTVVLMTSDTIKTNGVRVVLRGNRRTMHYINSLEERQKGPPVQSPIVNKSVFLEKEVTLTQDGHPIRSLKPGNYEFPYEFDMPGDVAESVEGMSSQFVTYNLKATLDKGVLAKDITARKPFRIIRTLSGDPSEWGDPQDVNGDWPDKIKYQFSTSSKNAIFGTKHITDIELTPLLEKLEIGPIRVTLKETRRIKTIPGPEYVPDEGWRGMWKTETDVHSFKMTVPDGCEDIDPQLQLPMYKFKARLDLPRSLRECRQSVDSEWIKIKHTINFDIMLKNPDGHWSELRAHYGIKLFISPNLPIGEDYRVSDAPEHAALASSENILGEMQVAPPDYHHHQLDRLYDDIDPSGFFTPGTLSGNNTPGYGLSRRGSADHIFNLTAVTESAPNPEALQNRLHALSMGRDAAPVDIPSGSGSGPSPEETPRGGSFSEQAGQPQQQGAHLSNGFDMDALERMPSYATAVRTPLRPHDVPPTYDEANSGPPSPGIAVPAAAQLRH